MEIETKYGTIKIFAKTLEDEAMKQIVKFAKSPLGENSHIRIMPDAHAGAGCVIGTTMLITDKVCPNIVGVDIGCGVDLVKTNIDFASRLEELDDVIRKHIPFGKAHHEKVQTYREFTRMKCWDKLDNRTKDTAIHSLGTLGGGNHFIEAYKDGYLSVHSGSRNIGWKVADYYQQQAKQQMKQKLWSYNKEALKDIQPQDREQWIKDHSDISVSENLAYLVGESMQNYLHDMNIMQEFAVANRKAMLEIIVNTIGGVIEKQITSTHNYIELSDSKLKAHILRKGAIAAYENQELVIPLNMRDGLLLCKGKENPDWNYSSPHGAGRLYSRTKAKDIFNIEQYVESMQGIYSTCINTDTIDEAPFAYKDWKEIAECIEPTVEIVERLIPIYNFKASD
jgi:RNA-splicing ligase RtcB